MNIQELKKVIKLGFKTAGDVGRYWSFVNKNVHALHVNMIFKY